MGDGDVFAIQTKLRHIQANLLQPTQQGLEIPDSKVTCYQSLTCFMFCEVAAMCIQAQTDVEYQLLVVL